MDWIKWRKAHDRSEFVGIANDKTASRQWLVANNLRTPILPHEFHPFGSTWQSQGPSIAKHNAGSKMLVIMPDGGTHEVIPGWWQNAKHGRDGQWGYSKAQQGVLIEPLISPAPEVYRFDVFDGKARCLEIYTYAQEQGKTQVHNVLKAMTPYRRANGWRRTNTKVNKVPRGSSKLVPYIDDLTREAEEIGEAMILGPVTTAVNYVRVDFLVTRTGHWFSELTTYPGNGGLRYPKSHDLFLGSHWRVV